MTELETEQERERKTIEYWSRAYDNIINNKDKDSELPYEPTAVLSNSTNSNQRKFSIYDIGSLDFTT